MSPTVSLWINIVIGVFGVIAALGTSHMPDYIPPGVAANIVETAGYIVAVFGAVNAGLHATSTSEAGPFNK